MRICKIMVFTFCLVSVFGIFTLAGEQKVMSVQVREAQVRSAPAFLGKIVANVPFGGTVEILEEKGDWYRVKVVAGGAEGWMHTAALNTKAITLKPGEDIAKTGSSFSAQEAELAGKGFEAEYQKAYANVNYQVVNQMETIVIPEPQMIKFLKEGQLALEGGAL